MLALLVVLGLLLVGQDRPARWLGSGFALGVATHQGVGMVRALLR